MLTVALAQKSRVVTHGLGWGDWILALGNFVYALSAIGIRLGPLVGRRRHQHRVPPESGALRGRP